MLDKLFGSKNAERILLYLLINERCYAAKLAQHFDSPLTPVQHVLAKLETIGILESHLAAKIRYYKLNPHAPFLHELEALLRKAYTLLPAAEQASYSDRDTRSRPMQTTPLSPAWSPQMRNHPLPQEVWKKLSGITSLAFSAASKGSGNTGWNGVGRGDVRVEHPDASTLLFYEQGRWVSREGRETAFKNVFRWSYERFHNRIKLEHLRFGIQRPVFLFFLAPSGSHTLESASSHVCKEDAYLGKVSCSQKGIKLNWRVIGPKKNEEIDYVYT